MSVRSLGPFVLVIGLMLLSTACASKGDLELAQTQLATLQQKVDGLNADLEGARAESARLATALQAAQTDVGTLKSGLSTAQTDVSGLKSGLSTAQVDVGTLKGGLTTAQADATKLKQDVGTASSDLSKAKQGLSALENTFSFARTDLDKLMTAQSTLALKTDLDKATTAQAKLTKAAKLSHAYDAWVTLGQADTVSEIAESLAAVKAAVDTTGDSELVLGWSNDQAAFDAFVASPTDANVQKLAVADKNFVFLLRKKQAEALQ